MLVLSRKKSETIVIDGNIEIEVLQVKGNSIRLGIKAPNSVKVLRGELKPFGMASLEEEESNQSQVNQLPEVNLTGSVNYTAQAG